MMRNEREPITMQDNPLPYILVYKAPKPRKSGTAIATKIATRIVFPPILLWDAAKFVVNKQFGEKVGNEVLPAQNSGFAATYSNNSLENYVKNINSSNVLIANRFQVKTHDGAVLDTLEIKPEEDILSLQRHKKYVINLLGNGMCYEQILEEMEATAQTLDCHVIGFNLRGVGHSSGKAKSAQDLVTDAIAQVQHLLDDGVSARNITLKGKSLGGGIGTLVAKHFYDLGIHINVFNDRSFSTITNVVVGKFRTSETHSGHIGPFGKKLLGWIINPFVKLGLALSKWEMDAASAFKSLPDTQKEYIVVRSSRADRESTEKKTTDDSVITHYGSLHAALKEERSEQKAAIDAAISIINSETTHSLIQKNLEKACEHLQTAKAHFKERKMITTDSETEGHSENLGNLRDRFSGKNAAEFFNGFFRRTQLRQEQQLIKEQDRENEADKTVSFKPNYANVD